MCTPLAIAAVAVESASIVAGEIGKSKAAKANKAAALTNLNLQYDDLNARAAEEQAAASRDQQTIQQDANMARSTAIVGAAEGNVAGASVTALLQDIARQQSNAQETVSINLDNTLSQIQRTKRGAAADAASRIAGVQGGSIVGAGLRIGSSVIGAVSDHKAAGLH